MEKEVGYLYISRKSRHCIELQTQHILKDIEFFREKMRNLSNDIIFWLAGTGVNVIRSEFSLNDSTIARYASSKKLGCYTTARLIMTSDILTAVFKADFLYGYGATGCASLSLMIGKPGEIINKRRFNIYMRVQAEQQSGWKIVPEHQLLKNAVPLDKDALFSAMGLPAEQG